MTYKRGDFEYPTRLHWWWWRFKYDIHSTDWEDVGFMLGFGFVVFLMVLLIAAFVAHQIQIDQEMLSAGCTHDITNMTRDHYIAREDWSCPYGAGK